MDTVDYDFFCDLLDQNITYENISVILKENYPNLRGLSVPSIKLFCKKHGLSSRISQRKVDEMVANGVDEVRFFFNTCLRNVRIKIKDFFLLLILL